MVIRSITRVHHGTMVHAGKCSSIVESEQLPSQ